MSGASRDYSDADLVAYLDGAAPEELSREIEADLTTDAALGQRVADLHVPMDALREGFDALLAAAPPVPDFSTLSAPAPAPDPVPLAAARAPRRGLWAGGAFATGLAAGLAIAIYTGLGTPAPEAPRPPGWKAVVASYQSLYTPDTLAAAPAPDEAANQLAQASAALGLDLSTLPEPDGLDFRRAQVLDFRGKTLIQIAYAGPGGVPVALCILPAAGPAPKDMAAETLGGLAAASWNEAGFAYLLIGGQDAAAIQPGADTFEAWSRGT
ncbi:MAG: anti-sigma factor [Pseudomonadota bacterium]